MPSPLVHRVRGEQIPIGENQMRLLEVIVDEQQRPLWRARCLQSGRLLNVGLDGLIQAPHSITLPAARPQQDDVGERKRSRQLLRWLFILSSLTLAALALYYHDIVVGWGRSLQEALQSGRFPGLPR